MEGTVSFAWQRKSHNWGYLNYVSLGTPSKYITLSKATCKQTQQLPTLVGQQCWVCSHSGVQTVMQQLPTICWPAVYCGKDTTRKTKKKEMLGVVGSRVWQVSNLTVKQHATTCNWELFTNNVVSVWVVNPLSVRRPVKACRGQAADMSNLYSTDNLGSGLVNLSCCFLWQKKFARPWMLLHDKRVQSPQDFFGTPTWPPFDCFTHHYGHCVIIWCENDLWMGQGTYFGG